MKRDQFVDDLSSYKALLSGIRALKTRGAVEASWLVVEGSPGNGKSRALLKRSAESNHILIRMKRKGTVNFMLEEICEQLGLEPKNSFYKTLFRDVCAAIIKRRITLIVDEGDHAAAHLDVIETLRDISDATECAMLFGCMPGCYARMARLPQLRGRIIDVVSFGPCTADDVRKLADGLCEVAIADDLVKRLHGEAEGNVRDIMNALGVIEQKFSTSRGAITSQMVGPNALIKKDHRVKLPALRMVASNG